MFVLAWNPEQNIKFGSIVTKINFSIQTILNE